MRLTLEEAAAKTGKSIRQLRYQMKLGRLTARKEAGRWFVELDDLPKTDGQEQAAARKSQRMRAIIDDALEVDPATRRYSLRDLRAFQLGLPIYQAALAAAGEGHRATQALRRMLEHLARGCHRYDTGSKVEAYRLARDEASLAVVELILSPFADAERAARQIEQDLLAALAGALRRVERQSTRPQQERR